MKKVINDPLQVVPDMFKGMSIAHPELECDIETGTVFRRNKSASKVAVITGGGSGHEPAHGGYVGEGMLDAAVAGNVFASPSADKIYKAMLKISAGRGIVQIIKNYSGDVMNFGMAKDLAELDGIRVEQIIVKDDVATVDDDYTSGRRGIAGTVFIHKIVGAAAESGKDLDEVARIGRRAVEGMRSVGFALTPCSLPAADSANFRLGDEEFEFGLGIHGEPGIERMPMKSAAEFAALSVGRILEDRPYAGKRTAVLINGLGSTPLMEQYIFLAEVDAVLRREGIAAERWYVGNYLTSFEMGGISTTLLEVDDELLGLLDYPCLTPAWKSISK